MCAHTCFVPLMKKTEYIESHESVALTDQSLFVLGVWELFFPTWIRDWTLLTGLLSLHAFWPILGLMGSFFVRMPQMLADIYQIRLVVGRTGFYLFISWREV